MNGTFSGCLGPGRSNSGHRRILNVLSVALIALLPVLTACGDKVPESEAAKRIGLVPKQTVDKAVEDTSRALQQGADRTREAEGGGQ